ncbi:MAG: hypothetical protein HFI08_01225 [Bacilli bacterium]|jgi:2-methylisocitrate lyase-like PEP mutase family enzyme|nr:hypothetical protein [Bacilli bacterium]
MKSNGYEDGEGNWPNIFKTIGKIVVRVAIAVSADVEVSVGVVKETVQSVAKKEAPKK